jgi:ABC-type glycerol-3-phosphate transport system permease component
MDREKILLNMIFLIFAIPVIYLIYYSYATFFKNQKSINPANPYNLYIYDFSINNNSLSFYVYNPSNYSLQLYFTYLGLKNSYQTSSIITNAQFTNSIYYLLPNEKIYISYDFSSDQNTKAVLAQWEKLGGYLYISLYYTTIGDKSVNGIINYEIEKS